MDSGGEFSLKHCTHAKRKLHVSCKGKGGGGSGCRGFEGSPPLVGLTPRASFGFFFLFFLAVVGMDSSALSSARRWSEPKEDCNGLRSGLTGCAAECTAPEKTCGFPNSERFLGSKAGFMGARFDAEFMTLGMDCGMIDDTAVDFDGCGIEGWATTVMHCVTDFEAAALAGCGLGFEAVVVMHDSEAADFMLTGFVGWFLLADERGGSGPAFDFDLVAFIG